MSEKEPTTTGTQLLDRAVALLQYLGDAGAAGARSIDMAEAMSLTPPTAHRIVTALERHGLIEKDGSTKRYRLGLSLFTLGAQAADGTGLRRVSRPALMRLAAKTGDTVFLMARNGFNTVCVDRQEGQYMIDSLTSHIGGQIPMGVGSASQAILAFLPPEEAEIILQANADRYSAFNGLTADEVHKQLPFVRERGYALDTGRLVEGISALALPILPQGRDVMAAVAVNMTSPRLSEERLPQLVAILTDEVRTIQNVANPHDLRPGARVSFSEPQLLKTHAP